MDFKDAYHTSNCINYLHQVVRYMDAELGMSYMRLTLTYVAFRGYYKPKTARILDMLPLSIKWLNIRLRRQQRRSADSPRWIDNEPQVPTLRRLMPPQHVGISQGSANYVRLHVVDSLFKCYGLGRKLEDLLNKILHGMDWLRQIFSDYEIFKAQVSWCTLLIVLTLARSHY